MEKESCYLALQGYAVPGHVLPAGAPGAAAHHVHIQLPAPSRVCAGQGGNNKVQAISGIAWLWGGGLAALAPSLSEAFIALTETPLTVRVNRAAVQTLISNKRTLE